MKVFLASIFEHEKKKINTINYIICSDKYLLQTNIRFLNHNYYTDVITFDLTDDCKIGIKAEIYLSADRIKDNAKEMNLRFKEEFLRVAIHGSLHLCGYEDSTPKLKRQMKEIEDFYLNKFIVPRET